MKGPAPATLTPRGCAVVALLLLAALLFAPWVTP